MSKKLSTLFMDDPLILYESFAIQQRSANIEVYSKVFSCKKCIIFCNNHAIKPGFYCKDRQVCKLKT